MATLEQLQTKLGNLNLGRLAKRYQSPVDLEDGNFFVILGSGVTIFLPKRDQVIIVRPDNSTLDEGDGALHPFFDLVITTLERLSAEVLTTKELVGDGDPKLISRDELVEELLTVTRDQDPPMEEDDAKIIAGQFIAWMGTYFALKGYMVKRTLDQGDRSTHLINISIGDFIDDRGPYQLLEDISKPASHSETKAINFYQALINVLSRKKQQRTS